MTQPKRRAVIDVKELDPELLEELAHQSLREIRKVRRHERIEVKLAVQLRPANSSDLGRYNSKGSTKDISVGGCRCIVSKAPRVGDIYRVQFRDEQHSLPMAFARCVRCRFVHEDAFDCSFMFLTPLEAPEIFGETGSDDLLD